MSKLRLQPSLARDFRFMTIGILAVSFTIMVWVISSAYNKQASASLLDIDADAEAVPDATGDLSVSAGVTVSTTGAAAINVTADDVLLDATATLSSGSGDITLAPSTGVTVGVGSGTGDFSVSDGELDSLSTTAGKPAIQGRQT